MILNKLIYLSSFYLVISALSLNHQDGGDGLSYSSISLKEKAFKSRMFISPWGKEFLLNKALRWLNNNDGEKKYF